MKYSIKDIVFWKKNIPGEQNEFTMEEAPFDQMYMDILSINEVKKLVSIGLEPKDIRTVPISQLYLQFRNEWPIHEYSPDSKERVPMPILESPLFELLEDYKKYNKKILTGNLLRKNSYYRMWENINRVGYRYNWYNYPEKIPKSYTEKVIKSKMERIINVYESIRKEGYRSGRFRKSTIMVLTEPFEKTRFGLYHKIDGYEIWSGHHRAAAMGALNINEVEVLVLEDVKC